MALALFAAKCPVNNLERAWTEESLELFRHQFGDEPLRGPVILPTSEFFPPPPPATEADVRQLVGKIAGYMGVGPAVTVEFSYDRERITQLRRHIHAPPSSRTGAPAGEYHRTGKHGRHVVTIDKSYFGDPVKLIAVIAHELGHVRLRGEHKVKAGQADEESLTDLVTVYLGMGIFTSDYGVGRLWASEFQQGTGTGPVRHLGYMTEPMFGYGLAYYARLRGEPDPAWARYLGPRPSAHFRRGVRYLSKTAR